MTPRIPIKAGALLFLLSFAICLDAEPRQEASAATQSPAARAMGVRWKAKGIPNFGKITPNLFRGGLPNTEGLEAL